MGAGRAVNYGFVIDNRKCIGCHACSTACKSENEVPLGVHRTWVKAVERGAYPHVRRSFQVTRCKHCENPPCVRICPVTAMYQRDDGIVEFDASATFDLDTSRVWWKDVGVHQNLTHAVHPDPVSGAHCWLQKVLTIRKAGPGERHGDVFVDTRKSMEVYRQWHAMTRSAVDHSPDGTRRPLWLKRPLKPVVAAYRLPKEPFGR